MGTLARTLMEMRGVSFAYLTDAGKPHPVFEGLDLRVGRGEMVCVLGPSGCGKTTLLNLAAGFLKPARGQVLFDGLETTAPGVERGVVFQEPTLFPWLTTRGNVEFGLWGKGISPDQIRLRAHEAMRQAGLAGCEEKHPYALSGGMRQRAALARVLALESRALLMDEPFGALDVDTREQLQNELLKIWREGRRTILFVTHNVEEAAYLADRVIVLGNAPYGVRAEVVVEMDRPRDRESLEMMRWVKRLREILSGGETHSKEKP